MAKAPGLVQCRIDIKNVVGALVLVFGLIMAVWGGSVFVGYHTPKATPLSSEDGSLWCDVIDSPSTGEMLMGLLNGPVGRAMGALLVAVIGLILVSGAVLSLTPTRERRSKVSQPGCFVN